MVAIANRATLLGRIFEDADSRLAVRVDKTSESLVERAAELGRIFEAADQQIATRLGESADALAARAIDVVGAMDDAEQRIASSAERAAGKVAEQVGETERRLSYSADAIGQKITDQVAQAEAHLVSRANVIAETFTTVGDHIGRSTNEAAKTIGVNTRELNEMLAARSAEITRILDETARPLIERFGSSGNELQQSLEAATHKATERLRSENAQLVNALASRTAETLAAVNGARSSLSESINDLIGRLSASSSQLNVLIATAHENLLGVDEKLSGTTEKFSATTDKAAQTFASSARLIDQNTSRLTELSQAALREVAAIASRFDEHGRLLANASNLISAAQSNFEHTMERQSSLEDLAVGLVKKSEDLERVMKSFESLVGDALDNAEGRTIETTDKIRESITDVIEGATRRFADATEDMRQTAAAIRSELEDTRAELKKGVIDMPVEAKESTTAIRRAVSEQINALKELSEIVAKSGRMYDVSDNAPARSAPPPPPRAAEPPRRPAPPVERREPQLRRPSDFDRPLEPRDAGGQPQAGWVSDLLRGASREDEAGGGVIATAPASQPVPPQRPLVQAAEPLSSLSVDIARAIDHEASIELWSRYRRGERDVFTRRLYTLKGQQTFDEVRRKYQTDTEFRAAVDRYCDDFEKLLKEIARNDRDNVMTQTYLTSDTGKVYTMLAHASGRLR